MQSRSDCARPLVHADQTAGLLRGIFISVNRRTPFYSVKLAPRRTGSLFAVSCLRTDDHHRSLDCVSIVSAGSLERGSLRVAGYIVGMFLAGGS